MNKTVTASIIINILLIATVAALALTWPRQEAIPNRVLWSYKGWQVTQIYGLNPDGTPVSVNTAGSAVSRAYIATKPGRYPLFSLDLAELQMLIDEVEK